MQGLTSAFRVKRPGRGTGSSTHRCSVCSREFARTEHLVRHERSHRGEKPFSCRICDAHFTRKELVNRHVRSQHKNLPANCAEVIAESSVPGLRSPGRSNAEEAPLSVGERYEDYAADCWEGLLPDNLDIPIQTAQLASNNAFDVFTTNTEVWDVENLIEDSAVTCTVVECSDMGFELDCGNFTTSATNMFSPNEELLLDFILPESDKVGPSSLGSFEISFTKRKGLLTEMEKDILHPAISLPGCLQLERYVIAFIDSMLPILPFVHLPTWCAENTDPCVLLAMAAFGAIYCKNHVHGDRLHQVARVTTRKQAKIFLSQDSINIPGDSILQALFLTISYGTWSGKSNMVQDALLLQSMLVEVFRHGQRQQSFLSMDDLSRPTVSWKDWIKAETVVRTRYTVYQFLNMLTWTMDIPPALVTSEISEPLPSSELEWKATSSEEWLRCFKQQSPRVSLTVTLDALLSPDNFWTPPSNAFANLIVIHALLQRIWLLRQDRWSNCTSIQFLILSSALDKLELASMSKAESTLSLHSEGAPQAYSLNALVRLARVYLCSDLERLRPAFTVAEGAPLSGHADVIQRSPASTRAASIAMDALRIAFKFGWASNSGCGSLQYFFSSLQCVFYLSKWLRTLESIAHSVWTKDEKQVMALIESTVSEFDLPKAIQRQPLSAKVAYASAIAFEGVGTWGVVQNVVSYIKKYAAYMVR